MVLDLLIGLGLALWFITALAGMAITFTSSENASGWGLVGGIVIGALAFLQLYLVAVVLDLLADITDGVNSDEVEPA